MSTCLAPCTSCRWSVHANLGNLLLGILRKCGFLQNSKCLLCMTRTLCCRTPYWMCRWGSLQPSHSGTSSFQDNFCSNCPSRFQDDRARILYGIRWVHFRQGTCDILRLFQTPIHINNVRRNLRCLFYLVPDLTRKSSIIRTRRSCQWGRVRSLSAYPSSSYPGCRTLYL